MNPMPAAAQPLDPLKASCRVLVATMPETQEVLKALLSDCDLDFVSSFAAGEAALRKVRYGCIVVGYSFAESRMFDFAQCARRLQPEAKVVCVKGVGAPLDPVVRARVSLSIEAIGAAGLLDLTGGEIPEQFRHLFNEILSRCRSARRAA
jgi:hypothetical protein